MKTILMTLLAVGLIGSLVGGALFAYFSDTETSTGNTFEATTITLAVNGEEEWSGPAATVDLKPCQWVVWEKDTLLNTGGRIGHTHFHLDAYDWVGGLYPEPEQEADGGSANDCDIEDYLELIVLNDLGDVLGIIQGAATAGAAYDLLDAAGYNLSKVLYMGLLKDFDCEWKGLFDLDPGQSMDIQFILHLREHVSDDNLMQGDRVTVDKDYQITQFLCDEDEGGLGGKSQNLPTGLVTANLYHPGTGTSPYGGAFKSYWRVRFSGIPGSAGDYDVQNYADNNHEYAAWCIDESHAIGNNRDWTVKMMSSLNPLIYSYSIEWGFNPPVPNVFNYVNYLINTYDATVAGESNLQRAIWYFIDGYTYSMLPAGAQTLVDDALLNGGTFVPEVGELALVVLFSPQGFQITGLEVDP